jgi:hypothetical protein
MSASLDELVLDAFAARPSWEAEQLNVAMFGSADGRVFEPLKSFFERVHQVAVERSLPVVTIDLRALEFMSSSCIKVFVSWLLKIQELAPERQYRLEFISARGIGWQRRTLAALSCFALDLVRTSEV